MQLPKTGLGYAVALTLLVSGCSEKETMLPDTLYFAPGTPIHYQGKVAKLYGTEACSHGALSGNSCLIFPPNRTTSTAVIVADGTVRSINVTAKRDPQNPTQFIVEDGQGRRLMSTSGHSEDMANVEISY